MKQPIDFVIITALEEELDAVLAKLPDYKKLSPSEDSVRSYYQADLPATFPDGSQCVYHVIVMSLLGMGRVQAATATSDAITQWHPHYLLLVGIAGGIAERKVNLGDILISDQIVDYELQKITTEGPEIRWEVHQADPRLLDAARNLRNDIWMETIGVERPEAGKPSRHIGPIASGDKVLAFDEALEKHRSVWPKLIGIEMEAAGAAVAAFQAANAPGFFMIRSVSDLADKKKGTASVEKWREYACHAAAAYAIEFLRSGPIPAREKLTLRVEKPVETPQPAAFVNPAPPPPDSILIVAATKVEAQTILEVFSKAANKKWIRQYVGNNIYYNLEIHGGAPVLLVQSEMGTATSGGTLLTVSDAIRDLHPQAVISCGIAYGLHPDKQKLGDILISQRLEYYEPQKLDLKHGQMQRGDRVTASERLLRQFRSGDNDWEGAPTHFGLVLSGEKLVNNSDFRDWLLKIEPEAIGGEMEGAGLYAAARSTKVDWILVKAICDWADGTKNDDAQPLAARNAAQFVLHVLQLGGWGNEPKILKSMPFETPFTSHRIQANNNSQPLSQPKTSPNFNPFIYGRPVKPDEFVDREPELRTVLNRLQNSESTAIVGEPHIGKTSFLLRLMDKKTQMNYLGDNAQDLLFSSFNFHYLSNDFTPTVFWEKALSPLRKLSHQDNVALRLDQLGRTGYASESLDEFFTYFDEQGQQLILIFDEFEMLLNHPNFQEFAFYATLRAVAARRSCSVILASRNSLTELQEYMNKLPYSGGSPVLNFLMELRLRPFDDKNAEILLARAGNTFSPKDKLIIRFIAGHHPYLVQTMAAHLMETTGDTRHQSAIEQFCNSTCSHFDDLWCTLPDRERTTVIVLGLVECGKCKLGEKFDYNEIQSLTKLGAGLHVLLNLGLAEHVSNGQQGYGRCLIWQDEQWTLGTQAFVWWVYELVVAGIHPLPAFDDWLKNEGYLSLLKPGQWERLVENVHSAVGPRIWDIGLMIENIFDEQNLEKGK